MGDRPRNRIVYRIEQETRVRYAGKVSLISLPRGRDTRLDMSRFPPNGLWGFLGR
jgi:hypothetical protein